MKRWREDFILMMLLSNQALSYMIDTNFPILLKMGENQDSSYFGYSAVLSNNKQTGITRAFIGAPFHTEPGTFGSPGAVYTCSVDLNTQQSTCFKPEVQNLMSENVLEWNNQMFGVDLTIHKNELYSCAPRRQESYLQNVTEFLGMKGTCWHMDLNSDELISGPEFPDDIRELFGDADRGTYFSLYAEAGFSLFNDELTSELLIGTPGAYDWSGSFLKISEEDTSFGNLQYSKESYVNKNDYGGYSIATGNFQGHKYILGAPRGGTHREGQILIISLIDSDKFEKKNTIIHQRFTGNQTGEYFGAALLVTDVNNDGRDDIIVGSPLYSTQSYDEGGITILLGTSDGSLTQANKISPNIQGITGGRFGISIASIGDNTGDGIDEIAVGAPGTNNGEGTVFIFSGVDLISTGGSPLQIIHASNIRFGLKWFGSVVSSGVDLDYNQHNDLIIGAPKSEQAIIIRTKPAIIYEARLEFEPRILTAETQNSFVLKLCYKFTPRKKVSEPLEPILTQLQLKSHQNIIFSQNNKSQILVDEYIQEVESCVSLPMRTSESFSFTRPSTVSLQLKQKDENLDSFCKFCGVLDPNSRTSWSESIEFQKDCKNQVCVSDLNIQFFLTDGAENNFVIGQFDSINLEIKISNIDGEAAYKPRLEIMYPSSVSLIKDVPHCIDQSSERQITCNIFPSPLQVKGPSVSIKFEFSSSKLVAGVENLIFQGQVKSESKEINTENNKFDFIQDLTSEVSLSLIAREKNEKVFRIGDQITDLHLSQTIQIKNSGSSGVNGAQVNLLIPTGYHQNNQKIALVQGVKVGSHNDDPSNPTFCTKQNFQQKYPEGDMSLSLNCGVPGTICTRFTCSPIHIDNKKYSPELVITGELIEEEVKNLQLFSISTLASLTVLGGHTDWIENGSRNYTTIFVSKNITTSAPVWQVVVSVLSGIVFVVLLLICLYRCGCFRRKTDDIEQMRKDQAAEKEFNEHNSKQIIRDQDGTGQLPANQEIQPMLN